MPDTNAHIEQFEAYLNGRMEAQQRLAFEERLQAEADFKQSFEQYQRFSYLVDAPLTDQDISVREERLNNIQSEIEAALQPEESFSSINWKILLPSLAAIVILLIVFWKPWEANEKCEPQRFYTDYASEIADFHFRASMSAGQSDINQPKLAAAEAYTAQDYPKALGLISTIDSLDSEIYLLQAQCYLQLDQFADCLQSLEQIAIDSEFYEKAVWIKALAALHQEDMPLLRRTLDQIVEEQNPNQSKAQKLEAELDCLPASANP